MTKREAAIVSAYTGFLVGEFSEFHKYVEEILERPVFTHEMADSTTWLEIKEASKGDFINLIVT
jgi:hypothetical protein